MILGVTTFLNRGYKPLYDALDYFPAVRKEVRRRELYAAQQQGIQAAAG